MLSVLIPVFNEEGAIDHTVSALQKECKKYDLNSEIVVINDGSRDKTAKKLKHIEGIHTLTHRSNRGYGAALKTGLRWAHGDWIAIIDADGTYRAQDLIRLYQLAQSKELDMMVGDRSKYIHAVPWYRRPGKAIIYWLAAFLLWQHIPDINCGLRVFRRDMAEKFMHLYPQGFSFTVTITLAALTSNYLVEWHPIHYGKRIGTSEINFARGLLHTFPNFIALVIRITTYFKPLRFFLIPSLLLLAAGFVNIVRTLTMEQNVTDASLLLLLVGLQIGLMGLLTDVVVKSRK